eukprot:12909862-Prorocentrum_lima.AAC.1
MSTVLTQVVMNRPWTAGFQKVAPSLQRSLHLCYFMMSARHLSICVGKDAGVQICWNTEGPYQRPSKMYWVGLMYTT